MKLILLALLFFTQVAFGRNIVLLTSLPPKDASFATKAERVFLKKTRDFSEEFKIVVEHKADQEVLHRYLNDPETLALFWVSHGGYLKSNAGEGVRPGSRLLDHQNDNVAKVFSKVHPNVKFIGVIGCNSEQILENILKEREDLNYYVPSRKVIGQFGLRKAIRHFRYTHHRKDNTAIDLPEGDGPLITVKRTTKGNKTYKSLKVFAGGELLTVLPKMVPNSTQEFSVRLPRKDAYSKQDLKLVFESGQDPFDATDTIGDLSVQYQGEVRWKLFSKPNGEPFGTNERIFINLNGI